MKPHYYQGYFDLVCSQLRQVPVVFLDSVMVYDKNLLPEFLKCEGMAKLTSDCEGGIEIYQPHLETDLMERVGAFIEDTVRTKIFDVELFRDILKPIIDRIEKAETGKHRLICVCDPVSLVFPIWDLEEPLRRISDEYDNASVSDRLEVLDTVAMCFSKFEGFRDKATYVRFSQYVRSPLNGPLSHLNDRTVAVDMSFSKDPRIGLMRSILSVGHRHPDRTGVGRVSVVGRQLRYALTETVREDGGEVTYPIVPMPTTRELALEPIVNELLWMISGETNIFKGEKEVKIWREWALQDATVPKLHKLIDDHVLAAYFPNWQNVELSDEMRKEVDALRQNLKDHCETLCHQFKGEIGPLYGRRWRSIPNLIQTEMPLTRLYMYLASRDVIVPDSAKPHIRAYYDQVKSQYIAQGQEQALPSYEEIESEIYCSSVDQFHNVVETLKRDPYSARMVVDAWAAESLPLPGIDPDVNVALGRTALTACHNQWQLVYDGKLNMIVNIRSSDVAIGLPTNTAFYAILCHMLAREAGLVAGELILNLGDAHLYENHLAQAKLEVQRVVSCPPRLVLDESVTSIYNYRLKDVRLVNYQAHRPMKYTIAV